MLPAVAVPGSDGKGPPLASYEEKVILRHQITNLDPGKKAAGLILQMTDVARQV